MLRDEASILLSYLAEGGPRSSAGDRRPRRAHKRPRSAGPKPADPRRREDSAMTDHKRVGVVHEHDILRRGIAGCLEEEQSLTLVFAVAEEPPPEQLDVAVVSIQALSSTSFECPVVIFHEGMLNARFIRDAAIAATLSLSQLTAEQLVASVRAAAAGLKVSDVGATRGGSRLDERRLEVLRLLAAGETTKSISTKLAYSERTIKTLIRDAAYELSARSRAHAVAEAIRQGLI
jgi:DNA-binding CsgD family transcriptional regulator